MTIAIASDHGGYELKQQIIKFLEENKVSYADLGTYSTESVDYPDIAIPCAEAVARGEYEKGIIICGTGIGVCIAANKVKGIRAALCHDTFSARMSRMHNNANILTMGGRVIGPGLATAIVKEWLAADFEGARHERRLNKISEYENSV
ncbi:MAG TPA: ribose 5-phosphate isomerase B [Thermoanaerobacterales bacterium]|uniref:ribose 5-phosphate isomerase B n=1 Tax=Tepidanaerobacter sp. GT38 TaxID=2722793 RepID=UPI0017A5E23E|nr:ribose 5-phosphate isomerase B [Tepidanaerobacter sp. GT38]MCG1012327.1 ribose 5-phosphate isomerase B [Tepidanaerobacter sp. GT38]HHY41435.1 ribose 5-phosphate isomerase B [Thermoanaerobacterales bacterium]